jgi:endonuclease-3 related protein
MLAIGINGHFIPVEWEVCVGAVLTQNTNWSNVEKALMSLKKAECVSVPATVAINIKKLQMLIKSSGFFTQKAQRLKTLASFVATFLTFTHFQKTVIRDQLLSLKGIGPETADSILLYACNRPYFVIDAYTRRLCSVVGITTENKKTGCSKLPYETLRAFFETNLPKDIELYKEFHALIVRAGKNRFENITNLK